MAVRAHGPAEFQELLSALLPPGQAFTREPASVLQKLLGAIADELAAVDASAAQVQLEMDPRTTNTLLPEWEAALGLPDPCLGDPGSIEARRGLVVARYTQQPTASRPAIIAFALALGFQVTIQEYLPFRCDDSGAGDALTNWHQGFRCDEASAGDALENDISWAFAWSVVATQATLFHFKCDDSGAGDPLGIYSNALLQCAIGRIAPAHTLLNFIFNLPP